MKLRGVDERYGAIDIVQAGMTGSDIVDLVTGLAWPVLIAVALWLLLPSIRKIIESRGFTITAGGMEITVQQASDQLAQRVEDVREQISALKGEVEPGKAKVSRTNDAPVQSPISTGVSQLRGLVWVDDFPENNAFEVEALERKGVRVLQARSTQEALGVLEAHPEVDAIISDMGRVEAGASSENAGLELLRAVREQSSSDKPVIIYASAHAVARTRSDAMAAGAYGVTSSATELLDMLGRLGLQ